MDIFTQPIHVAGMLAEVHRADLDREIEADRRARLVDSIRPHGFLDIVSFGAVLLVDLVRELLPWPGALADVDRRSRERARRADGVLDPRGVGSARGGQPHTAGRGRPAASSPW